MMVRCLTRNEHAAALSQLAERITAVMKFGADAVEDLFVKVKSLIIDLIVQLQVVQDFSRTPQHEYWVFLWDRLILLKIYLSHYVLIISNAMNWITERSIIVISDKCRKINIYLSVQRTWVCPLARAWFIFPICTYFCECETHRSYYINSHIFEYIYLYLCDFSRTGFIRLEVFLDRNWFSSLRHCDTELSNCNCIVLTENDWWDLSSTECSMNVFDDSLSTTEIDTTTTKSFLSSLITVLIKNMIVLHSEKW